MEIKILNSILFKKLMPWTCDAKGTKAINEKIKKVGSKEPTTEAQLGQQFQILLANFIQTFQSGLQSKIQKVQAL